jgi:hypothetical protein
MITDSQITALRAYLTGDVSTHERIRAEFGPAENREYGVLIAAGFFEAADRRFANGGIRADVVDYVGAVRSRSERLANDIDPAVAERLIMHVLGEGSTADLPDESVVAHQFYMLVALVGDERMDDTALDDFLTTARALADKWLR